VNPTNKTEISKSKIGEVMTEEDELKNILTREGFTLVIDDFDNIKELWNGRSKLYVSSRENTGYEGLSREPSLAFDRLYKYIHAPMGYRDYHEKRTEAIAEGISAASCMIPSIHECFIDEDEKKAMGRIINARHSMFIGEVLELKESVDKKQWDGSQEMREAFLGLYSVFKKQQFFTFNDADGEDAFVEGADVECKLMQLYKNDPEFYLNVIESPLYDEIQNLQAKMENSVDEPSF